jgi:N-acetylmuramoyl-L-alanine amidase
MVVFSLMLATEMLAEDKKLQVKSTNVGPKANPNIWLRGREYVSIRQGPSSHTSSLAAKRLRIVRGSGVLDFTQDGSCFLYNGCKAFLEVPFFWEGQQLYVDKHDFKHRIEPLIYPQQIASKVPSLETIVLDAGHGGKDPGTSAHGIHEKTWTLDVVKGVRDQLMQWGYRVVLTRDQDKFVSLADRVNVTKKTQADLFVSIHFNACANKSAHGFEIFIPTIRENSAWDTIAAYCIFFCMKEAFPSLEARGIRSGRLFVLTNNNCPSAVIEAAFMSNDEEFGLFSRPENRCKLARSIAEGIRKYDDNLRRIEN